MAMNSDIQFSQIRSIIKGEVNGSVRFMALLLCAALMWLCVPWLAGMGRSALATLGLQQKRFSTLSQQAVEYKKIRASGKSAQDTSNMDVMTIFNQVSTQISLGDRVSRLVPTPDGQQLSIEVNRIYAEELTDMIRELALRGIQIISAQLQALPAGSERLFSLTAVLGPQA